MISAFLAAICIKVTFGTLETPQCLRCLDAFLRVISRPYSRHTTLSFLFRDGISISNERKMGDLKCPKLLEKKN